MAAYDNNATRSLEAMLELAIADRRTTVTREREGHPDPFRGKTVDVAGPYTNVRIEPFKSSRVYPVFDEKGTTTTASYILLGLDIPREVSPGVPALRVNDRIIDADGNRYIVTSPPRFAGRVVEVNLDMKA